MQELQLCETLVREHYKEPIDGEFEDITASVLEDLQESDCDTDESDTSCSWLALYMRELRLSNITLYSNKKLVKGLLLVSAIFSENRAIC